MSRHSKSTVRKATQSGVTAIEAAILLPFFLMLTYGIIYLALFLTVQGILDTSAVRALTTATTSADFEISQGAPPTCTANSNDKFCLALVSLKSEMARLVSSGFVATSSSAPGLAYLEAGTNPVVTWPAPAGDLSYEQVLQANPITISITAQLRTFIPIMPTLRITGRAAGFREVRKALSYPVITDCNGYPKGHALYQQRPCVCTTPNSTWNTTLQRCETCDQGRAVPTTNPSTGDRTAPDGFFMRTPIPEYGWLPQYCACPSDSKCLQRHGGNAITFMDSCLCGCKSLGPRGNYVLVSDPATNTYEQCDACPGTPPNYAPFGGPGRSFSGYIQHQNPDGRVSCSCDIPLTDAECRSIFPPSMSALVRASSTGCSCECAGVYCNSDGTGPSDTAPPSFSTGNGTPRMDYLKPEQSQCMCSCDQTGGPRQINHTTGLCDCSVPCAGQRVRSADDACSESTCRCPANPPCAPGFIKNDADTNCACIPSQGGSGS